MTDEQQDTQAKTEAADRLGRTYAVLRSVEVHDFVRRLRKAQEEQDRIVHSLSATDAERRDALIRWHWINDLIALPKLDLLTYHSILGSQPENVLDLSEIRTEARA